MLGARVAFNGPSFDGDARKVKKRADLGTIIIRFRRPVFIGEIAFRLALPHGEYFVDSILAGNRVDSGGVIASRLSREYRHRPSSLAIDGVVRDATIAPIQVIEILFEIGKMRISGFVDLVGLSGGHAEVPVHQPADVALLGRNGSRVQIDSRGN